MGWFPMANDDGTIQWHDPDPRAVFPLQGLKPDRTTRRLSATGRFRITRNEAFTDVMRSCADPCLPGRDGTWINEEMISAYSELHHMGAGLSMEAWENGALVGGIYGVSLGRAFFGESMFSRISGASRVAFHHLVGHLQQTGFVLFDTQYINPHTRSLGAVEIPRATFRKRLAAALSL